MQLETNARTGRAMSRNIRKSEREERNHLIAFALLVFLTLTLAILNA
jgi:hypothetical protein